MSRLAKKPIAIPANTTVTVGSGSVSVKGPLGEVSRNFNSIIEVKVSGTSAELIPQKITNETRALWGTYASHLKNMIAGVNKAYEKKLIIEGIGFKAEVKGADVILNLGFSHPVKLTIPPGIKLLAEKGVLTVSGIDKELVGRFAAKLRSLKKPEPYKGKGIRYEKEVIRRKQGKKASATA